MAGRKLQGRAHFVQERPEPEAQRLHAHQVQLLLKEPARVIFTKAGGLDERRLLIGQSIGLQFGDGLWEHLGNPAQTACAGFLAQRVRGGKWSACSSPAAPKKPPWPAA